MTKKFWNSYWPGLLWTIAIFILLILPGSSFPKNDWFGKIYLDKWIHIFLFAVFVITWSFASPLQPVKQRKKIIIKLLIAGVFFGVTMEVVQHYWVSNRSFEVKDIMADAAGCLIGWLYCRRKLKK